MNDARPAVQAEGFQRLVPKGLLRRREVPPGKATVTVTGRTELNVGSTAMARELARQAGLDPATFAVRLGINTVTGVVTAEPVSVESPEGTPVRVSKDKGTMVLYLADLFDAAPEWRPSVTLRCPVVEGLDPENHRCLLLTLQTSLPK